MWIKNFINECKVWREIKKVYKKNKEDFLKAGLKIDWVGHIYKVINRDVNISLGTVEDESLLREELNEIQEVLIKQNVIDILAYELRPLEEDDGKTYEHGYLVLFTPAYRLDKQYLTIKNVLVLLFLFIVFVCGIFSIFKWVI